MKHFLLILVAFTMLNLNANYTKAELTMKKRAFDSCFFLTKYILGYKDLSTGIHKDLCDFIQNTKGDVLDEEPRDHFKTTCISVGYPIWNLIQNPNLKILINHKILGKSKEILGEIKGIYERNELFRHLFGDQVGSIWRDDKIVLKGRNRIIREPSIGIGSTEHELTSGHYNLIINDDLPGLSDMYSEAERARTLRFYKSLNFIRDQGNFLGEKNVCTRWHLNDLADYIAKNRKRVTIRIKTAILDEGTPKARPYFPERYPMERLLELQKEDLISFRAQMMNDPMPAESQIFKFEDLTFAEIAKTDEWSFAYADLAMSKKNTADYTAIVIGQVREGKIYIIRAWIERANSDSVEHIICTLCREHKIRKIGIESNSFQEIYVNNIKKRMQEQGISTQVVKVNHTTDKTLRISSIHGKIVDEVVFAKDWETRYPLLIQQLLNFPQGKHDDAPDALEGLLSLFEVKEARVRFI